MTKAQHAAMKLAVAGSLQADSNRENHNNVYAIRPEPVKRCPRCGLAGGLIFCERCHGKAA